MRALLVADRSAQRSALADTPPAQGAIHLTELLKGIEKSADCGHIDEVVWDNALVRSSTIRRQE